MITVCAPTKAAMLTAAKVAVPVAGAVTAAEVGADALVIAYVVLVVLVVAGIAVFIHFMRQPVWRPPKPLRRHAIPSYRAVAENPPAAISERHVIPGVVISRAEVPRQRDGGGRG